MWSRDVEALYTNGKIWILDLIHSDIGIRKRLSTKLFHVVAQIENNNGNNSNKKNDDSDAI